LFSGKKLVRNYYLSEQLATSLYNQREKYKDRIVFFFKENEEQIKKDIKERKNTKLFISRAESNRYEQELF
jgi:hypothetical protein